MSKFKNSVCAALLPLLFSQAAFAQVEGKDERLKIREARIQEYANELKSSSAVGLGARLTSQVLIVAGSCTFDAALVVLQAILDTVPVSSATLGHVLPWVTTLEDNYRPTYSPGTMGTDGDDTLKGYNGFLGVLHVATDLVVMLFDVLPDSTLKGGKYQRPFQATRKAYRTTGYLADVLFTENALCVMAALKVGEASSEIARRAKRDFGIQADENQSQQIMDHVLRSRGLPVGK
ncbi:MAG: hypothetical protein JNL01_05670 [Bdellovibrionales bacterium]|nr:hypothetical protein [Bdellovibrionales bacterium]